MLNCSNRNTFIGSLMVSAAIPAIAFAQPAETNRDEDVIIVEGQPVTTDVSDLAVDFSRFGTQVQVIDSFEIETGGFTNFGEAAAGLIRGANIGYSPDEGEFTIRIDGGTDRDTLLLVDGVPYFDRSSPLEDLWPATAIDPRVIDSVEVFRGGNSLYFGSNGGLGVVSVKTEEPDGTFNGEVGFYTGSFKTREVYGNVSFPLDRDGKHSVLFYGRSYESDAHELFSEEAYSDTVLALGGQHDFPYTFNSLGAKYLWQINDTTELRLGASITTIDFRDSFPTDTIFQLNQTEFPIYFGSFESEVNERFRVEAEAHFQTPRLENNEIDARTCNLPRVADLPADLQALAPAGGFENASEFEAFAVANDIPAGCVTNPFGGAAPVRGIAENVGSDSFYTDENGQPYGTFDNPFPIGAPIGYVIQSEASFGDRVPTKGFGRGDQFKSGYMDWGFNARGVYTWSDNFETVAGFQYTGYTDNSDEEFGVQDVTLNQYGFYGDLRFNLPVLAGTNVSLAGRYDINSEFDNQSVYKFGVRQNFGAGIYARASGGTSYSLPKIDEIGAFGPNQNINPGLEPQSVDTLNVGFGVDGEVLGGTFNVEVGYFDTEIENLFSNRSVSDVCFEYANDLDDPLFIGLDNSTADIEANRQFIVAPDEFCGTAASLQFERTQTVSVNTLNVQDIEGFTIDVSLDLDKIQLDFSFTDMESLQENGAFGQFARLDGTDFLLDGSYTADELATLNARGVSSALLSPEGYIIPGRQGTEPLIQSSERPEWTLSGLVTYTPTDKWIFALNPRWQGTEWANSGTSVARLVDEEGNRAVPDFNFGEYFVLNGSVQYFLGAQNQHRFLLRAVNILDEDYFERASGGSSLATSRAAVRGEIGPNDSAYYRQYGWNGKPRSFFLQYEYQF